MPDPIGPFTNSSNAACYEPDVSDSAGAVCTATDSGDEAAVGALVFAASPPPNASSAAVQGLVSRLTGASAVPNGVPGAPSADGHGVLLCRRIADLPLNSYLQIEHHFITTNSKAGGAGHCGGGVPGHGQVDLPFSEMCVNDHSAEVGAPGVTCEPTNADEDCVTRELEFGNYIGPWAPPFNDCQTFAADVITECSKGTSYSSGGSEGAPGEIGQGGTLGY